MFILKASYGNDSIAVIQWAHERNLKDVHVIYSDTGWAAKFWELRVEEGEALARSYGFTPYRIASKGFKQLVREKKAFPRQGIQFCTEELKVRPSMTWMDAADPEREAIVLVGKRRAESANRSQTPEFVIGSVYDSGRFLWHPIVDLSDEERNELVRRAGFEPLPHRSMECSPCINANKGDLIVIEEARLAEIEAFETEMGYTSKGKPRTMFRPYRYMGATGIREMVKWANSTRGTYGTSQGELFDDLDDGTGGGSCYSGQCGL
jgi:3'-phosphoadenosine 5'-phosphosulfate sulfotransferase (PAPS reductase)/FAD synthetase